MLKTRYKVLLGGAKKINKIINLRCPVCLLKCIFRVGIVDNKIKKITKIDIFDKITDKSVDYKYHIDVPKKRYYGISKGKKSGEYTKPKTRKGGERGGKGRHHRGNGNKGKKEN